VLPFRWWYLWILFMVGAAPIVLWIAHPVVFGVVGLVTLAAIYAFQFRAARIRLVTGSESVSRGTYYNGTTWWNSYLPRAHGWTVMRDRYSGPNVKTRISYTLDNYQGELAVSGREYTDGVVLADQRDPARARCVTSFAFDLDRDASGNWVGRLRPRLKVGMAVWLVIVVAWLALAVAAVTGYASELATSIRTVTIDPGGTARISGNDVTKLVNCNDGHLFVGGNSVTVTAHGHCAALTVSGNGSIVTVDSADTIAVSGINDRVTFHSGSPQIHKAGINNTVGQG
jgi:Protein of unknown function (DUF3060)